MGQSEEKTSKVFTLQKVPSSSCLLTRSQPGCFLSLIHNSSLMYCRRNR